MARGKTLVKLLDDLRAESRQSLNPAHNAQDHARQVNTLQRIQEWLWEDFAWPHLRVERTAPVEAGQRFYENPPDLPIDRIERIDIFLDGCWQPLSPGIGAEHYAAWNSERDERSWPPRRWRIYEDDMIEIWPIPDTDGNASTLEGVIKFTGIRELKPLVKDSDRADLDDRLLVLYAAAEHLASKNAPDAKLKLEAANRRFVQMRSGLTKKRTFSMFGVKEERSRRRFAITQYRPPVNS